jgi:hypothetical protein
VLTDAVSNFLERLQDWERQLGTDEWFCAKLRDDLLAALSPGEAFEAIDQLIDPVLSQRNVPVQLEIVVAIESLARHSNTTQMPPKLSSCWDTFVFRIETADVYGVRQLKGLRAWYRRPGL